jgi:hypothetical protein
MRDTCATIMTTFRKHWRRWILVGIAMDCVVLLFHQRIFGASNVTIAKPVSIEKLDGSPLDADGSANGIFTVGGNLTLAPGAKLTCGQRAAADGPCAVRVAVGGNFEMLQDSVIVSGREEAAGGPIEIAVGGNFAMRGPRGGRPGARITASDAGGARGGSIDVYAVGAATTEPGSAIASDAKGDGGQIAITAAATDIRGAVSARATSSSGHPGAIALATTSDSSGGPRS